eukprot:15324219-Ditylum_brightwellii.AAC.1
MQTKFDCELLIVAKEETLFDVDMEDGNTTAVSGDAFPLLDVVLPWDSEKCLNVGAYCKPKQALKYVDTS